MENLVLLIDDDDEEGLLLEIALQYCHHRSKVHQVTEYDHAVRFAEVHPDIPRLIFLDLRMPIVSGWDILRWIRDHPRLKDVPVIIWSHTVDQDEIDQIQQRGANYFLPKTADQATIKQGIDDICARWLS